MEVIKRETAGEKTFKARQDQTKYDAREVGHAMVEDNSIESGLYECVDRHKNIFDEEQFCVGYVIASDPLIRGVMRRKFCAFLYLPSPRPESAFFLYDKNKDEIIKRLWVLPAAWSPNPAAWTMEKLYTSDIVPRGYESMKRWSTSFYNGTFWEDIRKEHNIDMLSEHEYLHANREKLVKSCGDQVTPLIPDTFDFSNVGPKKIVDCIDTSLIKDGINLVG